MQHEDPTIQPVDGRAVPGGVSPGRPRAASFAAAVERLRLRGRWGLLLLPLAGVLLGSPALLEPHWYGDEGIFAAVATDIRQGDVLYREAWDTKPPFIFWTYAAIQEVAGTGMVPLRVVGLTALAAMIAAAYLAVAALGYSGRAWIAGVLVAAFFASPVIEGNLVMTETFLALFSALAAFAFVRTAAGPEGGNRLRGYLVAGVLAGVAANYKQVALWEAGAFFLMLLFCERRPLRPAAALAAGVLLPHAAVAAILAAQGALNDYWFAVVDALVYYRGHAPEPGALLWAARFLPLAMAVTYLAVRRLRDGRVDLALVAPLWASAALAGALSSTYPYPHYLQQAVVPGAVAIALVRPPRGATQAAFAAACVVAIAAATTVIYSQFADVFRTADNMHPRFYYATMLGRLDGGMEREEYVARFNPQVLEADALLSHLELDRGTLFAWHEMPWVYARSGLRNPTRFTVPYHEGYFDDARAEIMSQLEAASPDYLVLADPSVRPFPELEALARDRYREVASGEGWRLVGLLPGGDRPR